MKKGMNGWEREYIFDEFGIVLEKKKMQRKITLIWRFKEKLLLSFSLLRKGRWKNEYFPSSSTKSEVVNNNGYSLKFTFSESVTQLNVSGKASIDKALSECDENVCGGNENKRKWAMSRGK